MGTKRFEELEFCQLEEESRMEERKETQSSRLLQEQAESRCRLAQRKVRTLFVAGDEYGGFFLLLRILVPPVGGGAMGTSVYAGGRQPEVLRQRVSQERMHALEAQVKQLGLQAAQDCERLTKDKALTLQLLHTVGAPGRSPRRRREAPGVFHLWAEICFQEQERLCTVEKRYQALTGGHSFLKPNSSVQEVRPRQLPTPGNLLPSSFVNPAELLTGVSAHQ